MVLLSLIPLKLLRKFVRNLKSKLPIGTVGATKIAMELLGVPITNTTMIGAVLKATEVVKMESLDEPIMKRFGKIGEKNIAAMKRAYAETVIEELAVGKVTDR